MQMHKQAAIGELLESGKELLKLVPRITAGVALAGVPSGAALFMLDRIRKEKTQKERKKERELEFYNSKLESL